MIRSRLAIVCTLAAACGTPTEVLVERPESGSATSGVAVTAASPSNSKPDTTLDVQVLGSGFDRGSRVAFARDGVVEPKLRVNSTTYRKTSELIANVTVAADAEVSSYDVVVTTSKGKKGIGTELFAVVVPFETLTAPSGASHVNDVGPNGLLVGTISATCGSVPARPALWDQAKRLVLLPGLPGACAGVPRAVNGAGVVVGSSYTSSLPTPVRWIPASGGYGVEALPMLPGGASPGAWSINELGWVGASEAAAVWVEGTGWQVLAIPTGAKCFGTSVGNGGHVVSKCTIAGQQRGVFWRSLTDAPEVLPVPGGATGATPRSVDASGTVVGFASGNGFRAVRWRLSGTSWSMELLPDLGYGSSALSMNDAGHVAGSVYGKNGFAQAAFWTPDGSFRLLYNANRGGEALGISEPSGGLVIGGYYLSTDSNGKTAVRWLP